MRGPAVLPRDPGTPELRTRRDRFDDLVLAVVSDVEERWQAHLGLVEYAVEETPQVPDDWEALGSRGVPLSSLVRGTGGTTTRLVLFRRPIEHRCGSRADLEALIHHVVVEQVAELLGIDPAQVDPRFDDGS